MLGFAIRRGFLVVKTSLKASLLKFLGVGILLAAALWGTALALETLLAPMRAFRDETALLILIVVGAVVYGAAILLVFGLGWLKSLMRSAERG